MKVAIAAAMAALIAFAAAEQAYAGCVFTDVTAQAGIHFVHNAGRTGKEVPARDARRRAALSSTPMATAGRISC